MNSKEKNNINCQEGAIKDSVLNKHSDEILSPTRRSNRIRKTKISVDPEYSKLNEGIGTSNIAAKRIESLVKNLNEPIEVINGSHEIYNDNSKDDEQGNKLRSCNQSLENSSVPLQINSGERESFESMFNDIFGQKYTKSFQTSMPNKLQSDCLKERKFFKRKKEIPKQGFSNNYVSNTNNLPAEDVSKVFKIISKPDMLSDKPSSSKSYSKPSLKTYSNKRKSFQHNTVVESFGLPDCPIISEDVMKPITNNMLDAEELLDVREITILDLQCVDEPWIITNIEGESLFPYYEEVRIKAEPDRFRINGSFLDILDTDALETCDLNLFTSTPLNKNKIVNNATNTYLSSTPKNSKTALKNKEIDIEAIKMNFKKMLSKTDKEMDVKTLKKGASQKKKIIGSHSRKNLSTSREISFVKNDNITLEDNEIEISNSLSLQENTENKVLHTYVNDVRIPKGIPLNHNKKICRISKSSKLPLEPLSSSKCRIKKNERNRKKIQLKTSKRLRGNTKSKYSDCKNKTYPKTLKKPYKKQDMPKKKDKETGLLTTCSNCTITTDIQKKSEQQSITIYSEENENSITGKLYLNNTPLGDLKQSLDMSWNLSLKDGDNTDDSKPSQVSNCGIQNDNSNQNNRHVKVASQSDLTTSDKHFFNTKLIANKSKKSITANTVNSKRMLRSSSQEKEILLPSLEKTIESCEIEKNTSKVKRKHAILARTKINSKKCDLNSDVNNLLVNNQEKINKIPKVLNKAIKGISDECETNELSQHSYNSICKDIVPLKRDDRYASKLKIVITPLDLSQLLDKIPQLNHGGADVVNMSPTPRKLRSSKMVMCHTKLDQSTKKKLLDIENYTETNTFNDSEPRILKPVISEIDSISVLCPKETDSVNTICNDQTGASTQLNNDQQQQQKTKDQDISTPVTDSVFQQKSSISKEVLVGVDTRQKLQTDVITTNIEMSQKEEKYEKSICERKERTPSIDLKLTYDLKVDEISKECKKQESIETENFEESVKNENRKAKSSLDVQCKSIIIKEQVKDNLINSRIEEQDNESNVNTNNMLNRVIGNESKPYLSSDGFESNEKNKLESVNKLEEGSHTEENTEETVENVIHCIISDTIPVVPAQENIDCQIKAILVAQHESGATEPEHTRNTSFETKTIEETQTILKINENFEPKHRKSARKCSKSKIDDMPTSIRAEEVHKNKQNGNILTNDQNITICKTSNIGEEKDSAKNTEITTEYSELVKEDSGSCHLGERTESSELLKDKELAVLEEPLRNNHIQSACHELTKEDIKFKDNEELTPKILSNDTIKNISRKSHKSKPNNILPENQNENVEMKPRKRGRPPKRKSIDTTGVLNQEKGSYRSKSLASSNRNDVKITNKLNKSCTHNDNVRREKSIKSYRSHLKRSKSFTYGLHSSKKNKSHHGIDINGDVKQNEENAIRYKRKSDGCKNVEERLLNKKDGEKLIIEAHKSDEHRNFQVGDLAWGQIGGHPFWPCLITEEPDTKSYKKIGKPNRILYHVRFFGDNGRRAWVNKSQIMLYYHKNDLQVIANALRNEKKSPMHRFFHVRSTCLEKWQGAVKEAERLKSKSLHYKLSFFHKIHKLKPSNQQKSISSGDKTVKTESLKRKRSEKIADPEDNQESKSDNSSPVRKKIKKRRSDDINTSSEKAERNISKTEVSADNLLKDNTNTVPVNYTSIDDLTTNNNVSCINLRVRNHLDEISENDSKTGSENSTNMSLCSMEAQKALFKRNNLFKGVSRHKVCQYCLKPGEVLKCRGRCNGTYHIMCATEILKEEILKKRKEKSKGITNISEQNDNDSFSENLCDKNAHSKCPKFSNSDYNLRNTNKDKNKETQEVLNTEPAKENHIQVTTSPQTLEPNNILNTDDSTVDKPALDRDEDHVQIITVPSSLYNTPPRKTFPPNFKNMTLAEQIDYKMKEIMKKFESKTFYAESSVDSSGSEESSLNHAQSNTKCLSRCEESPVDTTVNTETDITLAKEKRIQEEEQEFEAIKSDNTSSILLTPVETPNLNNCEESIKTPETILQKSFVKHVTADCDIEGIIINDDIDPKIFKCGFCVSNLDPFCFICNRSVSKKGSNIRQKCSLYQCGRFYHPECLKLWPQTQWSLIHKTKHRDLDQAVDSFVCPLHVCHTCVSDDPRAATSRCSGDKIVKCLRCPSTYHSTSFCVPAGTSILSSTQILCPRHREKSKMITINTTWCFLCSKGGNLICCETCPTSVHPECLPVNLTDDDKFICEDCESGRLPLHDEIVWVRLGKFRWWPALILFPNEVPVNILNIKHTTGEFVVKFFGTYDYYWVNRGRSFLFQEGDTGQCNSVKKIDADFNRAVEEAVVAHKLKKEFKLCQEAESIGSLKPPPYIRIKVNKPVGNVRQLDLDLSSTTPCECDPSKPFPCGPDSDCLNRLLLTECNPDVCPAGNRCKNQSFEKREYPPLLPYKTQGRGWGLKTLAPIKKGQFVIEYVGELIDSEEYQRRIQKMHEQKEENYYFLTIDKDRMLDAGPKGNAARFMNHCCQPNCETQKWTVNGDTRVGLFATEAIPADTELTFNYNLECVGKEKKVCRCGAANCSGFIGVKAKQDTDFKKPKKPYHKKKKPTEPIILPPCFICGRKGKVGACNNKVCNKAYHLRCLEIAEWPEGNKFICPWHNCNICSKRTIRCCVKCISSYCPSHSEGNIRYDNLLGFVCSSHDSTKVSDIEEPLKLRRKKNVVVTDETTVTSTTSDDVEDIDDMPLLLRFAKYRLGKKQISFDSESESECDVGKSSASISHKRQRVSSDYDSQDEGAVSSATLTDVEDDNVTRKVLRQRVSQRKRKLRLNKVQNQNNTAICPVIDNIVKKDSNSELSSRCNELEDR